MRQQEKWTWWPFQDLDNNGRQEPKGFRRTGIQSTLHRALLRSGSGTSLTTERYSRQKNMLLCGNSCYTKLPFLQAGMKWWSLHNFISQLFWCHSKVRRASCRGNYVYFPTLSSTLLFSVDRNPLNPNITHLIVLISINILGKKVLTYSKVIFPVLNTWETSAFSSLMMLKGIVNLQKFNWPLPGSMMF